MEIKRILGTTYLGSKFINHDGTSVSDHPLYLFEVDDKTWLSVMFTCKSNPFTAHYPDGNDIKFICGSSRDSMPSSKVFQSEIYVIDKEDVGFKYSEYTFKYPTYHSELLKALKKALQLGIESNYKFGITSVHNYNNREDREDKEDIMTSLLKYVDNIVSKCYYNMCPEHGPVNSYYDASKKFRNSEQIVRHNKKVWRDRYNIIYQKEFKE